MDFASCGDVCAARGSRPPPSFDDKDQAIGDAFLGLREPVVPLPFRDSLRLHAEFGGEDVPGEELAQRNLLGMVADASPTSGELDRNAPMVVTRLGAQLDSQAVFGCSRDLAGSPKLLGGLGFDLVGQGGFEPPTT